MTVQVQPMDTFHGLGRHPRRTRPSKTSATSYSTVHIKQRHVSFCSFLQDNIEHSLKRRNFSVAHFCGAYKGTYKLVLLGKYLPTVYRYNLGEVENIFNGLFRLSALLVLDESTSGRFDLLFIAHD